MAWEQEKQAVMLGNQQRSLDEREIIGWKERLGRKEEENRGLESQVGELNQ